MRHEILRRNVHAEPCLNCQATDDFALYRADDGREWLLCQRRIDGSYCYGSPAEQKAGPWLVRAALERSEEERVSEPETVRDIDDVAPDETYEEQERREIADKKAIIGIPLRLNDFRGPFNGSRGSFHIFDAVRLDTGEEISFSGGTVLDQKGKRCKDQSLFPVNAQLIKQKNQRGGQDYWNFQSPEKA